jgi:hypothetical protein
MIRLQMGDVMPCRRVIATTGRDRRLASNRPIRSSSPTRRELSSRVGPEGCRRRKSNGSPSTTGRPYQTCPVCVWFEWTAVSCSPHSDQKITDQIYTQRDTGLSSHNHYPLPCLSPYLSLHLFIS